MAVPRKVMRWVVACTPATMAVLFMRAGIDLFTTVKATAAVLAAIAVLAVWVPTATTTDRQPAGARTVALRAVLALLALAIVLSTLSAPSPLRALVGETGRHGGAAVWLAALALAVAASSTVRRDGDRLLSVVTVAAVLPLGGYGLVQALGADPFSWSRVEGGPQVFATLGNADYLSAWLGMVTPLAVATALDADRDLLQRFIGLTAVPVAFGAAVASGSLQGPVAAIAGTGVVIATWATDTSWQRHTRVLAGATGLALVAAVVLLGLIDAAGSPRSLVRSVERSVETRTPLWAAAVTMAGNEPLTGVGPGHFVDEWFSARPDGAAAVLSVEASPGVDQPPRLEGELVRPVDDAHAVPLHLAATGGIPAAVLLLTAVTIVVGSASTALLGGPRSPPGRGRLALSGLLGAVAASAVVAVVSVEVAPLTVTAAVLVGATNGLVERLGAGGADAGGVAREGTAGEAADDAAHHAPAAVIVGIAVAAVVLAAPALLPLTADVVAGTAVAAGERGDSAAAGRRWERAADLAPWERRYPSGHSAALAAQGDLAAALGVQRRAVSRAPGNRAVLLDLARLTAAVEGPLAALEPYRRVVTVDPGTPALFAEAARNALNANRPTRAAALLRRAVDAGADPADLSGLIQEVEAAVPSTGRGG